MSAMRLERATLDNCHLATDLVVAIDVLRAFTTAAYLFDAGVVEILLVSGVEDAFALRQERPECLILGEVAGIKVPGFDLPNSPSEILRKGKSLVGRRIIQRTSAGTQGVVLARSARVILAASLVNATATCQYIRSASPDVVTCVQTGLYPEEGWGDEDVACADYLEQSLRGEEIDRESILRRVRRSKSGLHFNGTRSDFPPDDLELALRIDCFDFAMMVERNDHLHILHAAR
jgi:2-phosphosulfolactate phosphatase